MGSKEAPESFHSVSLLIDRQSYTAHLWRGGPAQWRLLSVEVCGVAISVLERADFDSCRASLEAAERAVQAEQAKRKFACKGAA